MAVTAIDGLAEYDQLHGMHTSLIQILWVFIYRDLIKFSFMTAQLLV